MFRKYKIGDILRVKNVPETYSNAFIVNITASKYHIYFLSMPDKVYSYTFSDIENNDVCFKISR